VRFKKISITKGNKINLIYEIERAGQYDEFSITSLSPAKDSFHDAMKALVEDVVDMCELPEKHAERIIVKGVSFSYGGERQVMGAVIISQMLLKKSNMSLNINTPHKTEEFYAKDGDPKQILNGDCVERLLALKKEAEAYVAGERMQVDMF
jgi:hypothetical protein